jgi:ATP-dependent helicase HrpB
MTDLPIEDVLPDLKEALRAGPSAVLQAPTGAGKTTRVPLALLGESWLDGKRILVLEPRRLAARSAARRMAQLRGERAGQTVGYRVRMDTQISSNTRIEVITEGVLTRMLQSDAALEGVGAVLFDEFHERSLQADLGLALTLQARDVLRPDLRVLVMSATLDAAPVADLLGDAPMITSEGRSYPVETRYASRQPSGWIVPPVVQAVRRVLHDEAGDVLVFLPGAGEIKQTEQRLREGDRGTLPDDVRLEPLFGNLSNEEQDRAIKPSGEGERKVVLATDIAESSLTIEGIRVVVDGGLTREPRFSPRSGMTRLETVKVSKASADQRKGRAGRVAPGVCERLWTRHTQQHLRAHAQPEIAQADLAPLALELAAWGAAPTDLRWLDPPPEAAYAQAQDLLRRLGALDDDDGLTKHGEAMADLGLHPRLAHLALRGRALGEGALACDLAALLGERDVFAGRGEAPDADLRLRLEALRDVRAGRSPKGGRGYRVKEGACHHVLKIARHWRRKLDVSGDEGHGDIEAAGVLAAFAYPDRLAQRRRGQDGRFRLRSGRSAEVPRTQILAESDYLAVAHAGGRGRTQQIYLAAPLREEDVRAHFGDQIEEQQLVRWDAEARRVRARRQERIGALVLLDGPQRNPDPARVAEALLAGVREEGLEAALPWSKNARRLRERMAFMHHHAGGSDDSSWPDVSEEALLGRAEDWLLPHLYGLKSAGDLDQLNLVEMLKSRLSWDQREKLDELAPTHLGVPSGSRRPIDYSNPEAPVLAVRLQEMFGLTETPRVAGGRVPLTLHLLSPAQRPVQVTQDLAHFWEKTYFEVRKDMRGRYPKHYWPEDPLAATPTNKVRPDQ